MAAPRVFSDTTSTIAASGTGESPAGPLQPTSPRPRLVRPPVPTTGPLGTVARVSHEAGVLTGVWPDELSPAAVTVCLHGRVWAVYPDPGATGDWIVAALNDQGEPTTRGALRLPMMQDETYPKTWWEQFVAGSAYPPAAGADIAPAFGALSVPGEPVTGIRRTPAQLVAPLIDLGRQLSGMATLDDALHALPRATLPAVAAAQHVAVTRRRSRDRYSTIASTDDVATQSDRVQYACGEGPCLDALTRCAVVRSEDLFRDPRWPAAGPRMAATRGVRSVLSIRLPIEGDRVCLAVNVYSCQPRAFDASAEDAAVLFAWQTAVALRAVRERERADQLSVALQTNRQIAKAIGLLMARLSVSDDDAFDMMRVASQHSHRRLTDVAESVLRTGGSGGLDLQPAGASGAS